ncbi:4Fe-4S dicluster-binding protein [Butyrivibrio sp. MC2021]|uniref:4Fe-4S dicluster-binding protein n=1 Tax=Butyrivibrio sp. MC2021 TaxID=1408306 RepID=UPI0009DD967D|nr:4Fe-4S dicluster-binding protein [Butyrivibrio sp. MC2021]
MSERIIPVLYDKKEECSGCSACYTGCPQNAISMVEDTEGFSYPKIDETKCISCNTCIRICPIKNALFS